MGLSQQSMSSAMNAASRDMGQALNNARQQLVDSLLGATQRLDVTLKDAGTSLTKEWTESGLSVKDHLEIASKQLGQSMQDAGQVLSQSIEDSTQSMEDAARAVSASLRMGAEDARNHFGSVGNVWEQSVISASESLRLSGASIQDSIKSRRRSGTICQNFWTTTPKWCFGCQTKTQRCRYRLERSHTKWIAKFH